MVSASYINSHGLNVPVQNCFDESHFLSTHGTLKSNIEEKGTPFLFSDLSTQTRRLWRAKKENWRIWIYNDNFFLQQLRDLNKSKNKKRSLGQKGGLENDFHRSPKASDGFDGYDSNETHGICRQTVGHKVFLTLSIRIITVTCDIGTGDCLL